MDEDDIKDLPLILSIVAEALCFFMSALNLAMSNYGASAVLMLVCLYFRLWSMKRDSTS